MRKKLSTILGMLIVLSLLLAACGGGTDGADTTDAGDTSADTSSDADTSEDASGEPVEIRWFVGLGTGQQPEQVEAQEAVVAAFNESHDNIELILEIVNAEASVDALSTQIAAGNAPDVVGPVGIAGSNEFEGQWLDLQSLVDSTGYDLSDFDPAQVEFFEVEGQGLLGLPFGVYPYFIYYNTTLFDEAGLNYPPHEVGEPYVWPDGSESEWNLDTLRELGMQLTVDANGNDATSADFDPDNIVQFGYFTQFTDPRGEATMFAAGNFYDGEGAHLPESWDAAFDWYYSGIWEDHFIPNDAYANSDLLAAGNPWASGNLAMAGIHLWCHGCYAEDDFDIAVVPSYEGQITAKLHTDTFRIMNSTEHPEEAFEVLSYLLGEAAPDLLQVYGAMPARISLQDSYFETLDEQHPQGVDWDVAVAMLGYPDNPNHEAYMPDFNRANERIGQFQSLYRGTPGLDIQAELEALVADLQVIFDEAQ